MTWNVLIFPGGTEIGLEIRQALADCKAVRLFSAGIDCSTHAQFVFKHHLSVPPVTDPIWRDRLNDAITGNAIDFVFPAHDEVLYGYSQDPGAIAAPVITSPPETCRITRYKSQTYDRLRGAIPVPEVLAADAPDLAYPVFVKPDRGQGSNGARRVNTRDELAAALADAGESPLVLEYLPGEEYTVDCFSDRAQGVLFCGARRRIRTKSGISVHGATVPLEEVRDYAEAIAGRLELHGAWFFQLRRSKTGALKLLEVAPRVAGTSGIHRVKGVNFPLLSIFEHLRVPVCILELPTAVEADRALISRFTCELDYDDVYVDLDDTLILRDQVNLSLVRFIFQCVNRRIPVRLITKHAGDLDRTLERFHLAGLFDEIIHLDVDEKKSRHIVGDRAIFIDDSFAERRDVAENCGIPTLDCSMVEMLHDWRV